MDQNAPFPGGRLFSYGTLMFEAVVRALLGRVVLSRPATLADYERQAIERESWGCEGPGLVSRPRGNRAGPGAGGARAARAGAPRSLRGLRRAATNGSRSRSLPRRARP